MATVLRHDDDLRRVLDASDIVRLIGEHVSLKARGREYVGLCPFHDDHDPSMCVVPHKQIFHCFVCGSGGNALTFVKKFHRMEFREALEFLAQRAGIELAPRKSASQPHDEPQASRADIIRANAVAGEFFQAILRHAEHGAEARAAINRRGISEDMTRAFALGASPDRWDGLLTTLRHKGLDEGVFRAAGLLKPRTEGSGYYDAFRGRLMFPICDQAGRIIAFGGRQLRDDGLAKYINSEETAVFRKAQTLYGLHLASRAIQKSHTAILVEGYTDVIACHQAGVDNVVAALGTALTPGHASILRRMCDTVILIFDGDRAGQDAADRATEALFAEPIDVKICELSNHSDAKDPDELLKREDGLATFRAALAASRDLLEFRFARLRSKVAGLGPAALSRAIDEEIEKLISLGLKNLPPIRRAIVARQLATVAGVDEPSVLRAIAGSRGRSVAPHKEESPAPTLAARLAHGECLLGCALREPALWDRVRAEDRAALLTHDDGPPKAIARAIEALLHEGVTPTLERVLARLDDEQAVAAAVRYERRVDQEIEQNLERLERVWDDCVVTWLRIRAACLVEVKASDAEASYRVAVAAIRERAVKLGPNRRSLPRPV